VAYFLTFYGILTKPPVDQDMHHIAAWQQILTHPNLIWARLRHQNAVRTCRNTICHGKMPLWLPQ